MFRSVFIVFALLAYLAGTGHCALATSLCLAADSGLCHFTDADTSTETLASPAPAHSADHPDHIPHGGDCALDTLLSAQNPAPAHGANRLLAPPALFAVATFVALVRPCALCAAPNAPPPGSASFAQRTRERLLLLAHGWQFQTRAALPVRAPAA